jgi:hypothetical protein
MGFDVFLPQLKQWASYSICREFLSLVEDADATYPTASKTKHITIIDLNILFFTLFIKITIGNQLYLYTIIIIYKL